MRLAILASLLAAPAIASAQRTSSDSLPHSGTWGAEVFLSSGNSGANLLRFQSNRMALLLGAEFNVTHIENDDDSQATSAAAGTQSGFAARLGLRTYRQSSSERLRPIVGFGARSTYSKGPSSFRSWSAGGYAELGATYFLTPHFSLGGTGELQASYGKRKQQIGLNTTIDQTTTVFNGSLMRVVVSVYF
jgi:hypothetical protein